MGSAKLHGLLLFVLVVLSWRIACYRCVGYVVSSVRQGVVDSLQTRVCVAHTSLGTQYGSCHPRDLQPLCRNIRPHYGLAFRRPLECLGVSSFATCALPVGAFADEGPCIQNERLLMKLQIHRKRRALLCDANAGLRRREDYFRELLSHAEADSLASCGSGTDHLEVEGGSASLPSRIDVVVVGGGHAGVEAAVAAARLGLHVALFSPGGLSSVGRLSCNPSAGGSGKSQLLAEADACGALLPRAADLAASHWRLLGCSGGPAAWSSRVLLNRHVFAKALRRLLKAFENIKVYDAAVQRVLVQRAHVLESQRREPASSSLSEEALKKEMREAFTHRVQEDASDSDALPNSHISRACGVRLSCGHEVIADAVVVAAGTFLDAVVSCGSERIPAGRLRDLGPNDISLRSEESEIRRDCSFSYKEEEIEPAATDLAACLSALGLGMTYFKTGTPARLAGDSIEWRSLEPQPSSLPPRPFSSAHSPQQMLRRFRSIPFRVFCFKTQTNPTTHRLVHEHLGELPRHRRREGLGVGPRYCPSIANKVRSFPDRETHPVWLEPEDGSYNIIYAGGLSGAFPISVQKQLLRSIPALQHVRLLRPAYDVEYRVVLGRELDSSLQTKRIEGLFLSGQIVGTTGYEEAGALGVVAGWNAGLFVLRDRQKFSKRKLQPQIRLNGPVRLDSKYSMIGILVHQVQTRSAVEPLRMLASRAAVRLSARSDNAAQRLLNSVLEGGLLESTHPRAQRVLRKKRDSERVVAFLRWRQLAQRAADILDSHHSADTSSSSEESSTIHERRKFPATEQSATKVVEFPALEDNNADAQKLLRTVDNSDSFITNSSLCGSLRECFVQRIYAPHSLLREGLEVWISMLRTGRRWTAAQLLALLPPSTFYPIDQKDTPHRVDAVECVKGLQGETKLRLATRELEEEVLQRRLQRELMLQRKEQHHMEKVQFGTADRTGGVLLSRDCVALQLLLALILQYAEECFPDAAVDSHPTADAEDRIYFNGNQTHCLVDSNPNHGSSLRELFKMLILNPDASENVCCSIYADTRYGFYLQRQKREAEACASGAVFPKEWNWTRLQFPFLSEEELEYLKTHQPKNLREAAATGCLRPASAFQLLSLLQQRRQRDQQRGFSEGRTS